MPQVWEIVGGQETGGVLVREGFELSSPKTALRLACGSLVVEKQLLTDGSGGERLRFARISGHGPEEGWISVALCHKQLAKRVENPYYGIGEPEPAPAPELSPGVPPSLDISGRWTMTLAMAEQKHSWFYFAHPRGSSAFTGRDVGTNMEIFDGRIFADGTIEWRISEFLVKGRLTDNGRGMAEVGVWHEKTGISLGYYTGAWDPGKEKLMVDNSILQAEGPGLHYCKSKNLEDVDHKTAAAAWGAIVVGIDQGDGWVLVVDRYLPREVDGKAVLFDPWSPPPKPAPAKMQDAAAGNAAAPARRVLRRRPAPTKQRHPCDPPEYVLGAPLSAQTAPKLTRAQVVFLQKELIRAFSEEAFQRALAAHWKTAEGKPAEQTEVQRKACSKAHFAALWKVKTLPEEEGGEALTLSDHLKAITSDPELCCNTLLLHWLLNPRLQAHILATNAASVVDAADAAADDGADGGGAGRGGYEVVQTDAEDDAAIRGIGRCRGTFARAHLDLYRPFYSGMLHNEWLGALGRQTTEQYLEEGILMLHAEQTTTREVVGYIACRCEDGQASINHIGVLPAHQGRGVGRMLFEKLLQHLAQAHSRAAADLWINVVELNTRAVSWYRRLGFSVVGMWTRSFCSKSARVPVAFLTMRRAEGVAKARAEPIFTRSIVGARVAIFEPQAPQVFLEAVARHRWPWLCMTVVSSYESDTGKHQLQDGRRVDLNLEFSRGRAIFDRPLHDILPK